MSNPNIYELMKISKELDHLVEETGSNSESESANLGWWILGGLCIVALAIYFEEEINKT